ncbi:MAG: DUF3352 domain-containing protein [Saprospiraceae bacterium]|nr:DUF3352 domain-containing protein [Saprospiraceae bacterium]
MEFIKILWSYFIKPVISRHLKKILIGGSIIILVLWIGSSQGYFRMPFSNIKGIEAFSENTPMILVNKQQKSILEEVKKTIYFDDLLSLSIIKKWEQGLLFIDSLFSGSKNYSKIPENALLFSGVQIINNNNADWLYVLDNYEESFNIKIFIEELNPIEIDKTTYRGQTIYSLKFRSEKQFSIAVYGELILISHETIIVESSIEQLDDIVNNASRNESFVKVSEQNNHHEGYFDVYINMKTIYSLIAVVSKPNQQQLINLETIGQWLGMDARFLNNGFMMSGHLYPEAGNKFLLELSKQKASENSIIEQYIPQNFAAMLYLGWNDFKSFYHSYKEIEYKDFENYFLPWIGSDIALILNDPIDSKNSFAKDRLVLVHSKDTLSARSLLNEYANQFGELNNTTYQNFEIRQIVAHHPLRPIFGEHINPIQNPYYIIVDEYVVFANSETTLENWIKYFNTGRTIEMLPEYQAFFKHAKNRSNIYTLLSTPNSMKFLQYFMRDELHEYIKKPFSKFKNIYPIGIQFYGYEKHFLVTFTASYNKADEMAQNQATIAWDADLQAQPSIDPKVVQSKDGDFYIFIQDTSKTLYFFDKNGENLWPKTKRLQEKINSEIYEIDFYGNGEIQYAFSTANNILILDRQGKEIKRIPLISKATNGVVVHDFGNGPRFFIACENGGIYGYDQNGKPVSGWQPLKHAGTVDYSLACMTYNKKNYLVTYNKSGACKAYMLNGDSCFGAIQFLHKTNGWGVDASIGRIAVGAKNGKIRVLNSLGKGFGFSAIPHMTENIQFLYADVIGDERKDYIRFSDKKMALHYYAKEEKSNGKTIDKIKRAGVFSLNSSSDRHIFEVSVKGRSKKLIGLVDRENGNISLLNSNGEVQKGFPLPGTSRFTIVDLFSENSNTLIVANNNKLYAYKLK